MSAQSTTQAVSLWDNRAEEAVKKLVNAGQSVPKGLVMSAPKGFISDLRRERKSMLMQNSSRIQGEIAQQGFVICGQKAIRTDKLGNQRLSIEYIKPVDAAVKAAETLGVPVEVLRASINAYKAQAAKGTNSGVIQLPKAA